MSEQFNRLNRQRMTKKMERDCETIINCFRKVAESQKPIDPDIQKVVDEHFWEML